MVKYKVMLTPYGPNCWVKLIRIVLFSHYCVCKFTQTGGHSPTEGGHSNLETTQTQELKNQQRESPWVVYNQKKERKAFSFDLFKISNLHFSPLFFDRSNVAQGKAKAYFQSLKVAWLIFTLFMKTLQSAVVNYFCYSFCFRISKNSSSVTAWERLICFFCQTGGHVPGNHQSHFLLCRGSPCTN